MSKYKTKKRNKTKAPNRNNRRGHIPQVRYQQLLIIARNFLAFPRNNPFWSSIWKATGPGWTRWRSVRRNSWLTGPNQHWDVTISMLGDLGRRPGTVSGWAPKIQFVLTSTWVSTLHGKVIGYLCVRTIWPHPACMFFDHSFYFLSMNKIESWVVVHQISFWSMLRSS